VNHISSSVSSGKRKGYHDIANPEKASFKFEGEFKSPDLSL